MDRYELAWAAGFFDAEGWAGVVRDGERKTRRPMARINQVGDGAIPQVLLRFQSALGGLGAIGGPDRAPARQDLYRWSVSSRSDIAELFTELSPWVAEVKLAQLATASRRVAGESAQPQADEAWSAWAAGLFDGDGCSALLRHRTHAGYLIPELSVTQSANSGPPQVLRRFAAIVGVGAISGPYAQGHGWSDVYRWKAAARGDCERVITQLWPFLGMVKRVQAQRLIDTLASQPALPRGNPAFGYHKTHCVHGHEYAVARVRPFVARAGGDAPRENQKCLSCLREYARAQREKKTRSAVDEDRRSMSEALFAYVTS